MVGEPTRRPLWLILVGVALVSVALASTRATASPAPVRVEVFFAHGSPGPACGRVAARRRLVRPPSVLRETLAALLRGPTESERALGYGGWFSARTAGKLHSVRIAKGVAYVDFYDFRPLIPNASSSCGSTLLLAQLDRTAHQFAAVHRAVYSFNGSRDAFYEWLQRSAPHA